MSDNFLSKLFTSVSPLSISKFLLGSLIMASSLPCGVLGMDTDEEHSASLKKNKVKKDKNSDSEEDFDLHTFQTKYRSITDPDEKFEFLNELELPPEGEALKVKYMWELASPDGPPSEARYNALRWLGINNVQDEAKKAKVRPIVFKILTAENISLSERFEVMPLCKAIPFSILFSFFKQISALEGPEERKTLELELGEYGSHFFDAVIIDSSQQEEIKNSFLTSHKTFLQSSILRSLVKIWAPLYVENNPQGKVELLTFLSKEIKACKDASETVDLISLYLGIEKNLGETDYDQRLWASLQKADETSQLGSMAQASKLILKYSHDLGLKKQVTAWLIKKAQGASTNNLWLPCMCLKTLLKYGDQEIKIKALKLCENLMNSDNDFNMDDLRPLVRALKTLPEGQNLKDRILKEQVIPRIHKDIKEKPQTAEQDEDSNESEEGDKAAPDLEDVKMLLSAPNAEVQQDAFSYFKNILIGRNNEYDPAEAADMVVGELGADNPLAQEAIQLMIARDLGDDPRSAYGVYRLLLEKRKEAVIHRPQVLKLADGRLVTFNLNTLKKRRERPSQVPLVKHSYFIALAEALVKEVQENPGISNSYDVYAPGVAVSTLLYTAKDTYFQQLLDGNDATVPKGNISLINLKLRKTLTSLPSKEIIKGLSPHLTPVLALLVAAKNCPTNKDDGIDLGHRTVEDLPLSSQETREEERRLENYKNLFMEEQRNMREGLLNGEGAVIKQLLFGKNPPQGSLVFEPAHQGKFTTNLVSHHLGLELEGEPVPFDLNGGIVLMKLREYSTQQFLDTLFEHYTPERVLSHYHEKFNKGENKAGVFQLMKICLPKKAGEIDYSLLKQLGYATFNEDADDFKVSWTPLATAAVLLRLNILKEVSTDKKN